MNSVGIRYCGSIWHHGIKGQKWGVRRSPEELGHVSKRVEKSKEADTIVIKDGSYISKKGFTVPVRKLTEFCLRPDAKHFDHFDSVGYREQDADLLFRHIEDQFDMAKARGFRISKYDGHRQFSMPMMLGVTEKQTFLTSWQCDEDGVPPRLTSAYRNDKSKGER